MSEAPSKKEIEELIANPYCGCWDGCKCGGGTKAIILANALAALTQRETETAAKVARESEDRDEAFKYARECQDRAKKAERRVEELEIRLTKFACVHAAGKEAYLFCGLCHPLAALSSPSPKQEASK